MNFQLKSPWNGTHLHQTPGWLTQYSSLIQVQNTISVIDLVTCIDVQLIFDSVRLGLSSAANILQVADVALRVVFFLFLPCFFAIISHSSSCSSCSWNEWNVCHLFFHNQNNSTSSPGLLGNSALTCSGLHFWRHFLVKHKILPNLVISNWLWWIMRVLRIRIGEIFWMNNNVI